MRCGRSLSCGIAGPARVCKASRATCRSALSTTIASAQDRRPGASSRRLCRTRMGQAPPLHRRRGPFRRRQARALFHRRVELPARPARRRDAAPRGRRDRARSGWRAKIELPILPRGGGTALAGQTCNTALVIDFSKYLNAIRHDRRGARGLAVVEPGVVQAQLNAAAAPNGLFFAPDPSTKDRCTIGGMIGNNSCGAHSAAHGKTVDNVEALDVAALRRHADVARHGQRGEAFAAAVRGARDRRDLRRDCARSRIVTADEIRRALPENSAARLRLQSRRAAARKRASTWRARWSVRKARSALRWPRRCRLVPRPRASRAGSARLRRRLPGGRPGAVDPGTSSAGARRLRPSSARLRARQGASRRCSLLPDGARVPAGRTRRAIRADEARGAAERLTRAGQRSRRACTGVAMLFDRCGAARGVEAARVGTRRRRVHRGPSAYLAGRRGYRGAAGATGRLPAPFRAAARRDYKLAAATYYGHFGEGCVHCRINFDFSTPKASATFRAAMLEIARPGGGVRRLAFGRAWRRACALGTVAQDVRRAN